VSARPCVPGVTIRRVTSLREFDDLTDVWRRLTHATGQICPLLSHDWFACCWRTAGPNRRREVWVCEEAGQPVAFVPLVHARVRALGVPVRVIGFLGTAVTPLVDMPVAGAADHIATALIAELRSRHDWDVVSLPNVRATSMIGKALMAALPGALPWSASPGVATPFVTISGTWDDFVRARHGDVVAAWTRAADSIARRGAIAVEEHRQVDPDGPIFRDLVEVSWAAWPHVGRLATSGSEAASRFLRELTRRASCNGWLRLWMLRVDGRPVATEYQLGANGSVHTVRADHDPSLREHAADVYLRMRIVQSLFERGDIHEYDLPAATAETSALFSGRHETVTLEVYAPTALGRLLHRLDRHGRPLARRLRGALAEWQE